MNNKIFCYARVSSKEQNEERQLVAFKELGIDERDICIDKQSGEDFDIKSEFKGELKFSFCDPF